MDYQAVKDIYLSVKMMTSKPSEITQILLKECQKNVRNMKYANVQKDIAEKNIASKNAQGLLIELMSIVNLNNEQGEKLFRMYEYLKKEVIKANLRDENKILEEVEEYLLILIEAWTMSIQKEDKKQLKHNSKRHQW